MGLTKLHRGPWQTSLGAMEANGHRRAGAQSKRGSPTKLWDSPTQNAGVRGRTLDTGSNAPYGERYSTRVGSPTKLPPKGGDRWPYPLIHLGTHSHPGH